MEGDRLLMKKSGFLKTKKLKLIVILVIIGGGIVYGSSIYNQGKSDTKVQAVTVSKKGNDINTAKQKQEKIAKELEQKKIAKKLEQEKAAKAKILKDKILLDKKTKEKNAQVNQNNSSVEQNNALIKQEKIDAQKKVLEEKVKKEATDNIKLGGVTTKEKAIALVSKIIINKSPNVKVECDHIQNRNGINYYVVRAYDDMGDHIATLGCYYVQVTNGKAYEWNLVDDKLVAIN